VLVDGAQEDVVERADIAGKVERAGRDKDRRVADAVVRGA
jgi:hypothetical protein